MRKRGVLSAATTIQVPFYDVDSMHVVWHGHYVKYLEQARCALLEFLEYDYLAMQADGYAWPVVDMHLRYVQPAQFGQRLLVRAELVEWEHRLKINYLIQDETSGLRLTRASSIQVAIDVRTREMQLRCPDSFLKAVQSRLQASAT